MQCMIKRKSKNSRGGESGDRMGQRERKIKRIRQTGGETERQTGTRKIEWKK